MKLQDYLRQEAEFFRGLNQIVGKTTSAGSVSEVRGHFTDARLISLGYTRLVSLLHVLSLLDSDIKKGAVEQANKCHGLALEGFPSPRDIPERPDGNADGKVSFGWVVVVIAVVIVAVMIKEGYAQEGDSAGIGISGEHDVGSGLTEAGAFLAPDAIAQLGLSAWLAYLLLMKNQGEDGEYMKGILFGTCANLEALVEAYGFDHSLIVADGATLALKILYAARLEECGIPLAPPTIG